MSKAFGGSGPIFEGLRGLCIGGDETFCQGFPGVKPSKIRPRRCSVEFFLRYRLSGTGHDCIQQEIPVLGTTNPIFVIWKMPRSMLQGGLKVKDDAGQGKGIRAYQFLVLRLVND